MMDDHEARITETVDDFLDDRGVPRPIIADLAHPVLPGLPNKAFERIGFRDAIVVQQQPDDDGLRPHTYALAQREFGAQPIDGGPWSGYWEVKTHSEQRAKAPSSANIRQVRFRMRLRELSGAKVYGPSRIVTIPAMPYLPNFKIDVHALRALI